MDTRKEQLTGWKEIAAYLRRDERTVKRWEKQRGLPVRRIPGDGRANVYAIVGELKDWLAGAGAVPRVQAEEDAETVDGPDLSGSAGAEAEMGIEAVTGVGAETKKEIQERPAAATVRSGAVLVGSSSASGSGRWRLMLLLVPIIAGLLAVVRVRGLGIVGQRGWARRMTVTPNLAGAQSSRMAPERGREYRSGDAAVDELYLQGTSLYEERTPASLDKARSLLMEATKRAPEFAPAYAGLANVYLLSREYSTMPSQEAFETARVAAQRAVALDANLPEAHASLGFIAFFYAWNGAEATKEFETALRLDPNCVKAQHWYGSMLAHEGRYAEALEHLNAAQRLEPSSAAILATKALALGLDGSRDEGIEMLQSLTSKGFDSASPHRIVAILSLEEPRRIPLYLDEMHRVAEVRRDPHDLAMLDEAAKAYQRGGERAMWRSMLQTERRLCVDSARPTHYIPEAEAALGLDEDAMRDMALLVQERDPFVIGMVMDPLFQKLHGKSGFKRIVASVGLPGSF